MHYDSPNTLPAGPPVAAAMAAAAASVATALARAVLAGAAGAASAVDNALASIINHLHAAEPSSLQRLNQKHALGICASMVDLQMKACEMLCLTQAMGMGLTGANFGLILGSSGCSAGVLRGRGGILEPTAQFWLILTLRGPILVPL